MPKYTGTSGNDRIDGSGTSDEIFGFSGSDTLYGNSGGDYIYGGQGNDLLYGELGVDYLYGEDGNDVLIGGDTLGYDSEDFLYGGTGDDTFLVSSLSEGFDGYFGEAGADTILATSNAWLWLINFSLANNGIEVIAGQNFYEIEIRGSVGGNTLDFSGITLVNVTAIYGDGGSNTGGSDTIIGSYESDRIYGEWGNDILSGAGGNDFFRSNVTTGHDIVDGGDGFDTITADVGSGGWIGLKSVTNIEQILGGGLTNARIVGDSAANMFDFTNVELSGIASIQGGDGNDSITGSTGNDTLIGGAGADSLNGGAGSDTADYSAETGGVAVNLFSGLAQTADGAFDTLASIENINGGAGNDQITGDGAANILNGNGGADSLWSYGGNDTVNGGDGDDTLAGGDGIDTLYGNAGNDWIYGEAGNDILFGGPANAGGFDVLVGGAGDDVLDGGIGDFDYFYGGDGATGGGNDIFVVAANAGIKVLNDFEAGGANDAVRLTGTALTNFAQVQAHLTFSGTINGTVLTVDANTQVWFLNRAVADLTSADFIFA